MSKISRKAYQQIVDCDGVVISGHNRSYLYDIAFEKDMSNKNVLDIGSSQGSFCLEAMKRGACKVVGIEPLVENIKTAKEAALKIGLEPEYIQTDFENYQTNEQFDTILCLNVLHHMYDPIHVLRKMVSMARNKIIIEFATPRLIDVWNKRISIISFLAKKQPLLVMGKPRHPKDSVKIAEYTFMFTSSALKTFFNTHYSCFGPVVFKKSPFKGRMIAIIQRRKINTITVIAGPTSSGKTTLIEKIEKSSELRKKLNIPNKIDAFASYKLYEKPIEQKLDHVIMHYDILRPFRRAIRTHYRDPVLSILSSANKVNVLTLKIPSRNLIQQITKGEPESSARHQEIKKLYSDPEFLNRWYRDWYNFVSTLPNANFVFIDDKGNQILDD